MAGVNRDQLHTVARQLLLAIGEDANRPGLRDTPRRFADMWAEFIDFDPGRLTVFANEAKADQMVVVSGMGVWSLCEHHLLPFYTQLAVGYLPKDRILGLSKFGRLAQQAAHKLQLQERLVEQLAGSVIGVAATDDVAVTGTGVHLCMAMRGVQMPAAITTTVTHGAFRENPATRAEFLATVEAGAKVRLTP